MSPSEPLMQYSVTKYSVFSTSVTPCKLYFMQSHPEKDSNSTAKLNFYIGSSTKGNSHGLLIDYTYLLLLCLKKGREKK